MIVTLTRSGQHGEDGPKEGALGYLEEIRKIDDEYWGYVEFPQPTAGIFIVKLDDLMHVRTETTESYLSTSKERV